MSRWNDGDLEDRLVEAALAAAERCGGDQQASSLRSIVVDYLCHASILAAYDEDESGRLPAVHACVLGSRVGIDIKQAGLTQAYKQRYGGKLLRLLGDMPGVVAVQRGPEHHNIWVAFHADVLAEVGLPPSLGGPDTAAAAGSGADGSGAAAMAPPQPVPASTTGASSASASSGFGFPPPPPSPPRSAAPPVPVPAAAPAAASAPATADMPAAPAATPAGSSLAGSGSSSSTRLQFQGQEVTLITNLAGAKIAADFLQRQSAIAMDTEGELGRGGAVSLVQLAAEGLVCIFDLHAMQPAVQADVLRLLRGLLENGNIIKVLHDCRSDSLALFCLHDIRLAGVWDTQVAHAVAEALQGMGSGGKGNSSSSGRIGLNPLLELHSLPPNPHKKAVHKRMEREAGLWRQRPLPRQALEYAAADVTQLLALREAQRAQLGAAGAAAVEALSAAHAEWLFEEGERSYSRGGTRSYAAAAKLPLGIDMELLLEAPDYRPRFAVPLAADEPAGEAMEEEGGASGAAAGRSGGDIGSGASSSRSTPSSASSLAGANENAAGNVTLAAPALKSPALAALLPQLFPGQAPPQAAPADTVALRMLPTAADAAPAVAEAAGEAAQGPAPAAAAAGTAAAQQAGGAGGPHVDAEAECILSLFPAHVRQAILAACASSAGSSNAPGDGREAGRQLAQQGQNPAWREQQQQSTREQEQRQRRLVELVVDRGRPVVVRFGGDGGEADLDCQLDVEEALDLLRASKQRLHLGEEWAGPEGSLFFGDNRTGIPGTLHRISAIRGRDGRVLGLTYRIGRHIAGVSRLIMDILAGLSVSLPAAAKQPWAAGAGAGSSSVTSGSAEDNFVSPSLLLLGPPGVGKSTLLRDVSGVLANEFRNRVIVVDTSNEIAGDGDVPHPCIGRARRMMVPDRASQFMVMLEAVQNHTPQVVVVDEVGTAKEVQAAKSIAQRGVVMVGTAHGVSLECLLKNPELNPLVGGVHQVLLGDREAKKSHGGVKTKTERRGAPCFATLVEVLAPNCWRVHPSVARSVDAILAGRQPPTQLRWVAPDGRLMVRAESQEAAAAAPGAGLARQLLEAGGADRWLTDLVNLAALY